ncbi:MAG: acetyltransferase [Myxococcales bacterium]|nr:acetyltransferase [Myxococcales bacterium]
MPHHRSRVLLAPLCALALGSCGDEPVSPPDDEPTPVAVGEDRDLELRYMRLDVEGFDNRLSLEDLRAMPRSILADVWLADLDVTQLLVNSLEQLRTLSDEEVAELTPAAQNMRRLLLMTPDNANLEGTSLEELISLSGSIGFPKAVALAELLDVGVTDDFIPPEIVARVMLRHVVGSHPNAQWRRGPVDSDHPDGLYPVAENSIPLTLIDVVTNFEDMAERFGPVGNHPGFVSAARGLTVVEEDFVMSTKVNANALPFKGADLTNVSVASVNSVGSQIETVHDYSDPEWMDIEGLVPDPRVSELTFTVVENDAFIAGGTTREPVGQGNSPAWDLPEWEFERLIVEMAKEVAANVSAHCVTFDLDTGAEAFRACVDEAGWVTMETFNNLGDPPRDQYLWDLILEIAQVRLHDGGLAEGAADVALSLRDVEVGVETDELIAQTRKNLEQNPEALREFASLITNSTEGDADFYYVRVGHEGLESEQGDWLFFVTEDDLRLDDDGRPVREYAYERPGFFADRGLDAKVSSLESVDGDVEHEKVRIQPGDVLYILDDEGQHYEIRVGDKPGRSWVSVDVTRLD